MTTEKLQSSILENVVQEWTIEDMMAIEELLDSDQCELLGSGDLIDEESLSV
jgi:hypothetical protein